jgi:flagellar biosynthesis/type III secretory pathway chaperone
MSAAEMPPPADTGPPPDFDALLVNLELQADHYDRLLDLSERERVAIGQADLATLAALVAEKERIVAAAQLLECQRMILCAHLARQRGMPHAPDLDDVRAWATSQGQRTRLETVAVTLSQRVSRLRQSNARNADIITQAQRMSASLIAAALRHARHPLYTPQGATAPEGRPSLIFDYRA